MRVKGQTLIKIYDQLGWESLTDRRYRRRHFHFYKIQNAPTPSYMKDPLPSLKNHPYSTRSEFVLHELKCHSDSFINSFYSDSVRCWNRLGHVFRDSPNLQSFKKCLLAGYIFLPNPVPFVKTEKGLEVYKNLTIGNFGT